MIKIEKTKISPTIFVTPSSRYIKSEVLLYGENGILTFNTYKKNIILLSSEDKFTVVSSGEEFRPDKTSYKSYGTVDFWWAIMEANNIHDIYDYKVGLNIRIPIFSNLFGV